MKPKARESLDTYYREAGTWAQDRQDMLHRSRRVAWIIASVAASVALFEALALLFLTPLKTVEPYTLLVDRETGYIQALKPLNPELIGGDAALTQSFIVQYVIARESYDIDSLQTNYRKVALWSAEQARSDYLAVMPISNPESPLAQYRRTTVIQTRIKSVSPMGQNVAMVRFETQRRDAEGRPFPARAWVAIVRYRYSNTPLNAGDRFVNPLGFEVVRYTRNIETLSEPEPPADTQSDGGSGSAPTAPVLDKALPPSPAPTSAPSPEVEL